jgi:hypothetical protein
MFPTWVIGVIAIVLGLLAFWQKERIAAWNKKQNARLDKPGALATEVGTPSRFGVSGLLMAGVGVAMIAYTLITGR